MGNALFKNWGNTDIPTIANRKQISPLSSPKLFINLLVLNTPLIRHNPLFP